MSVSLEKTEWNSMNRYFGWVIFEEKTYSFELVQETIYSGPLGINNFTRIYFTELLKTSLKKKLRKYIQSELLKDDNWKEKISIN